MSLISVKLLDYINARQSVIDELKKVVNNKEVYEKTLRSLLIQRGTEGGLYSPLPLKDNNLWLLDDKFMSYNYVGSEKTLNDLFRTCEVLSNNSTERPDIAIYTTNKENVKRVILVELKKFSANYKENGTGITQLKNYAIQLQKQGVSEIYLYLLAELDDKLRDIITLTEGFTKVCSFDGDVYQKAFDKINSYMQVLSPSAIVADADTRNRTFLQET